MLFKNTIYKSLTICKHFTISVHEPNKSTIISFQTTNSARLLLLFFGRTVSLSLIERKTDGGKSSI